MLKNLTSGQLFLISLATVILLIAAFSLFLLQDPTAPLPFALAPTTGSPTAPPPTNTLAIQPSDTPIPTRQTSYTPFATLLTPENLTPSPTVGTGTITPNPSQATQPGGATPSVTSTRSSTHVPSSTSPFTLTPTSSNLTTTPTITETLAPGYVAVTGQVLRNATPIANVKVEFKDDVAPRQSNTDQSGHYRFFTLAPGAAFSLTFRQSDNPQLTPPAEITSLASIEGSLPTGVNPIDLPDLELSILQDGSTFELMTPVAGAAYPASIITSSNPLQFTWADYHTGVTYRIELGLNGSDQPLWSSPSINSMNYMWDGTLSDGRHVSEGDYWWRVSAIKTANGYTISVCTHTWDLTFY